MKRAIMVGFFGGLLVFPLHLPSADAGGVPGTKERITFEGLVGRHERDNIPAGYDGFGWSGSIYAIGRGLYKDQQGFQALVHGKVAAANLDGAGVIVGNGGGRFSLEDGYFAAFGDFSVEVTFKGYRQGVVVGTKIVTLDPVKTFVQFDSTFAHIDKFTIEGVQPIAMDDMRMRF